jgi:TrpR-related protein YerC/YecD
MARVNTGRLTTNERSQLRQELIACVQALQKEDVWRFLDDLLTSSEVLMLARRLRIAKALLHGKRYEEIAADLKVSFSTVQLVDRAIQRGLEGYRRVIDRTTAHRTKQGTRKRLPNESIEMLRRIPGSGRFHFWLDILDTGEDH